jgi:hypothetical protein
MKAVKVEWYVRVVFLSRHLMILERGLGRGFVDLGWSVVSLSLVDIPMVLSSAFRSSDKGKRKVKDCLESDIHVEMFIRLLPIPRARFALEATTY